MPTRAAGFGVSTPKRHSALCRDYRGPHVVDLDCLFEQIGTAPSIPDRHHNDERPSTTHVRCPRCNHLASDEIAHLQHCADAHGEELGPRRRPTHG